MGFWSDLSTILFGKVKEAPTAPAPLADPKPLVSVAPHAGGGTVTTIGAMEGPALSRPMQESLWTKPEPSPNLHTPAAPDAVVSNHQGIKPETTMSNATKQPAPGAGTTTHSMPPKAAQPVTMDFESAGKSYRQTTQPGGATKIERLNAAGEVAGPVKGKDLKRLEPIAQQHGKMDAARKVNEGVKKGMEPVNNIAGDIKEGSKSTSSFFQKTKNIFFKSEGFVANEMKTLKDAGKEIPTKLKAGNARWGMMGAAAAGAVVLASVVASIGGKGSGKHAEQEMARRQEPQAGVGVA